MTYNFQEKHEELRVMLDEIKTKQSDLESKIDVITTEVKK